MRGAACFLSFVGLGGPIRVVVTIKFLFVVGTHSWHDTCFKFCSLVELRTSVSVSTFYRGIQKKHPFFEKSFAISV